MMISRFKLVRHFSKSESPEGLVTRREFTSSEDALMISRDRLENEHRDISCAVLNFFEDQLHFRLQINPKGLDETICLAG